jgi:UDP-3-O-[3-hydroxymyristoyl] glucosamine N-acyltransferase
MTHPHDDAVIGPASLVDRSSLDNRAGLVDRSSLDNRVSLADRVSLGTAQREVGARGSNVLIIASAWVKKWQYCNRLLTSIDRSHQASNK